MILKSCSKKASFTSQCWQCRGGQKTKKKKQFIEISAVFRENSWKKNLSVKGCPPKLKNIEVQSILKNCCTTIDDLYCDHSSVGQKLVFVNQKTLEASLLFFCSFWPLSASLRICQRTPLQKLIWCHCAPQTVNTLCSNFEIFVEKVQKLPVHRPQAQNLSGRSFRATTATLGLRLGLKTSDY